MIFHIYCQNSHLNTQHMILICFGVNSLVEEELQPMVTCI